MEFLLEFDGLIFIFIVMISILFTILIMFIYHKLDAIDPEPLFTLFLVIIIGGLTTLPAITLNFIIFSIINPGLFNSEINSIVIAPIIEEFIKALSLLLISRRLIKLDSPMDGLIYGVAIGSGFSLVENVIYGLNAFFSLGSISAIQISLLRGFTSFIGHPIYTGIFGFGLGGSQVKMYSGRFELIKISIFLHALWNFTFIVPFSISPLLFLGSILFTLIMSIGYTYKIVKLSWDIEIQLKQKGYFENKREYRIRLR